MKLQDIPIKDIKVVENHRTNIERTHLDELMQSIKQHGLMQPIGVARQKKGGKYLLRFGQRRFLACQKLGHKTIQAMVSEDERKEKLLIENLTENMQRTDPSFAEMGRVINKLEKMGLSIKEISARLGIPLGKIKQIVEVYNLLPEKFQKKVVFMQSGDNRRKGYLPAAVATKIITIKKEHGLKDKDMDSLFKKSVEYDMDTLDLSNVGALIGSGMSTEEAIKNSRKFGVYTLDIAAKHEEILGLIEEHGLLNRKSLFAKIIYGELPPLNKPSFVFTGLRGIYKNKDEKRSNAKIFKDMRSELVIQSKLGTLSDEQVAALEATKHIKPKKWTDVQRQQIKDIYDSIKRC